MVSSIIPGSSAANALGVDTRFTRPQAQAERQDARQSDRVEFSGASLAQARESVRTAMGQVHEALAAGHDAQAMLVKAQAQARSGDQAGLTETLAGFNQRVEAAIGRGANLLTGADLAVQAEPGAPPVVIAGVDLRLSQSGGGVITIPLNANADDVAHGAQKSLETLQDAMSRLVDSARALEAHQGFLGAVDAANAGGGIDADGARLLALQVRQGLEASGAAPIANVEPQAVLSLFRA